MLYYHISICVHFVDGNCSYAIDALIQPLKPNVGTASPLPLCVPREMGILWEAMLQHAEDVKDQGYRNLELLILCREILDKGFLGHSPSPSTEPRHSSIYLKVLYLD